MTKCCQKLLLSALIILQVVAPLVHAHTDKQGQHFGIHLPGLEFIAESGLKFIAPLDFSNHFDEGVVVRVSSGIKHNPVSLILLQYDQGIGCITASAITGFIPNPLDASNYKLEDRSSFTNSQSARAPPIFNPSFS